MGGSGGEEDTIESYDFNEERWTQALARMTKQRQGCAAAAIENNIYVAGGDDDDGSYSPLVSFEAFDVDAGLCRKLPSMSTARFGCAGVAVGDEFMVFGESDEDGHLVNTAEVFNVRTGRWEDLPPMNNRRQWFGAAVINNKVYVVGGEDETGSLLDTVDVFNMTTRTWTLLPQPMTTCCCAAAAVGKYLVVAGGGHTLNTVEMYDVEAESWMELPSMSTERCNFAAVSLGGSVYIMGGEYGSPLDSVKEIQFSDDVIKEMLGDWSEGSWSNEVLPTLHRRTSVIPKLDVNIALMPTLLSRVGEEERVQTIFEMVKGEMGVFRHTYAGGGTRNRRPSKKQKRC